MPAITRESIGVNPIPLRQRPHVEHRPPGEDICQTENRYAVTIITFDLVPGHFCLVCGHYHDTGTGRHVVDYRRGIRKVFVIVVDDLIAHHLAVAAYL